MQFEYTIHQNKITGICKIKKHSVIDKKIVKTKTIFKNLNRRVADSYKFSLDKGLPLPK